MDSISFNQKNSPPIDTEKILVKFAGKLQGLILNKSIQNLRANDM